MVGGADVGQFVEQPFRSSDSEFERDKYGMHESVFASQQAGCRDRLVATQ
jgi:hypothetical protein